MTRGTPRASGERREWVSQAMGGLLAAALGVVLGIQYLQPNKRVIPVLLALVVFGIAWRIDMVTGLGILVLTLPYPKSTTFGNTNLALILLLLVIWLLRVTQRQSTGLARTPLDVPLMGLLITWIVSFTRITDDANIQPALQNTQLLVAGILLFYMIASTVRTERDLERLHGFQLLSLVTICSISLYELGHPGGVLVPGWIEFIQGGEEFGRNVRVGGPFFDFELLSEYCAISLLLAGLMFARANSASRRALMGLLMLLTLFIQFATVTRGAFVSLAIALAYLAWITRRRLRIVPLTLALSAGVALILGLDFVVANFTRSGDLFARFSETQFKGLVPDTRTQPWAEGWERFMQSPLLGHGPYYALFYQRRQWFWPHNGYLYLANLVGVIGVAFFLWMLAQAWRMTRPRTDTLRDPSYAKSYLVIAHVQLLLFIVDQVKIDFLRNPVYQFQVWLLFASIAAAYGMLGRARIAAVPAPAR